ncbi:MAG: hypothetical protein CL570_06130 [Alphaproteobacteria bacterium]|nr:hypothetical protein [Alphaproteobacteria bacterium]
MADIVEKGAFAAEPEEIKNAWQVTISNKTQEKTHGVKGAFGNDQKAETNNTYHRNKEHNLMHGGMILSTYFVFYKAKEV